jgi:hypothetical protein
VPSSIAGSLAFGSGAGAGCGSVAAVVVVAIVVATVVGAAVVVVAIVVEGNETATTGVGDVVRSTIVGGGPSVCPLPHPTSPISAPSAAVARTRRAERILLP